MTHKKTIGSRAEVWHGTAIRTSGGLRREDLMMNKYGRIVSKKKHNTAKAEKRLVKYGYGAKAGKFGYVKLTTSSSIRSRKRRFRKHSSRRNSRSKSQMGGNHLSAYEQMNAASTASKV